MDKFYYINLTKIIIEITIEAYNELGPGLHKNIYIQNIAYKLNKTGFKYNLALNLPLKHKDVPLSTIYISNLIIDNKIILELMTKEKILPIHETQLLTSMKLAKIKMGLLINFKKMSLNDGIKILLFHNNNFKSHLLSDSFKEDKKDP